MLIAVVMIPYKVSKIDNSFLLEGSVARHCELHQMKYCLCCSGRRLVAFVITHKVCKSHDSVTLKGSVVKLQL